MLLWLKVVSNYINASVGSILSSNCDIVVLQGEFLQLFMANWDRIHIGFERPLKICDVWKACVIAK